MESFRVSSLKRKSKCIMVLLQKQMPVIAAITIQVIVAGQILFSKASIASGIKPSIFTAYRLAFATLALSPFAFFIHREGFPPLTFRVLCKIFIVSSGLAFSMNVYLSGMEYASATIAMAISSTSPGIVFIVAVCFRMEKLATTKKYGVAKICGAILGLLGAMVFTFYKGLSLYSASQTRHSNSITKTYTRHEWIKGSLMMLVANFIWCLWLIAQAPILKEYPATLRLTTLQCVFSCMMTTIYAAVRERSVSSWKLGWDVNLLSVAYCGIVVSGISYALQVWVVDKRGPVFTAMFLPLSLVITAICSAIFFEESLYMGSLLGCVLLVVGLYSYLWGKNKEVQTVAQDKLDLPKDEAPVKCLAISISTTEEENTPSVPKHTTDDPNDNKEDDNQLV